MKLFYYGKDGGYESTVYGYWLVEIKSLFSIVLLKFENGSRDAYHTHAFNCISWVLKGQLTETLFIGRIKKYLPSFRPVITTRDTFHKVESKGNTWVISFRGPWTKTWKEFIPKSKELIELENGRKIVAVVR